MSAKVLEFRARSPKAPEPKKSYPTPPNPGTVTPLKNCPFCGSRPKYVENQKVGASQIDTAAYIVCTNEECGICTPYFYPKNNEGYQNAIDAWNRRV